VVDLRLARRQHPAELDRRRHVSDHTNATTVCLVNDRRVRLGREAVVHLDELVARVGLLSHRGARLVRRGDESMPPALLRSGQQRSGNVHRRPGQGTAAETFAEREMLG